MRNGFRRINCIFYFVGGLLEILSLIGAGYVILALFGVQECSVATCRLVYYGAFFVISAVSIVAIFRWKRWGVMALATTAGTVALIDYLQGASTLLDLVASLALIAGAGALMSRAWPDMD